VAAAGEEMVELKEQWQDTESEGSDYFVDEDELEELVRMKNMYYYNSAVEAALFDVRKVTLQDSVTKVLSDRVGALNSALRGCSSFSTL
jgi:hypothetical protein